MVETEVKFLIKDPQRIARLLEELGAQPAVAEIHELNLRFDRPDRSLARASQVLRLRRDSRVRLTYKGPRYASGDAGARTEIEFEAGDFDAAQAFLEALGYEVSMLYEKTRRTYHLGPAEVVLDRTPLGHFVEIEGPGSEEIEAAARRLGLDWSARCLLSYTALFDQVKAALGLDFRDLTFENFEGIGGIAKVIGVEFAD